MLSRDGAIFVLVQHGAAADAPRVGLEAVDNHAKLLDAARGSGVDAVLERGDRYPGGPIQ